jgi:DNA-binding PadR family transcriptional regulator
MTRRRAGALLPLELAVLEAGLAAGEFHGFAIAKALAHGSSRLTAHGTLYKALGRLEAAGLLTSRWEDPAPEGRPRRRLYTLTGRGGLAVTQVARTGSPAARPRPGLAT